MEPTKDGYLYTFGNEKHAVVFMERILPLSENHRSYTCKVINEFFEISNHLINTNFRYNKSLLKLALEDCITRASKYLDQDKQRSYLENLLKTRVKKLYLKQNKTP